MCLWNTNESQWKRGFAIWNIYFMPAFRKHQARSQAWWLRINQSLRTSWAAHTVSTLIKHLHPQPENKCSQLHLGADTGVCPPHYHPPTQSSEITGEIHAFVTVSQANGSLPWPSSSPQETLWGSPLVPAAWSTMSCSTWEHQQPLLWIPLSGIKWLFRRSVRLTKWNAPFPGPWAKVACKC